MTDRSLRYEIWVQATPERVFPYFSDIELWRRWQAIEGMAEGKAGGRFRVGIVDNIAAGEFLVVDPPSLLVMTWGWEGSELLPPGASTVTVELALEGSGTRVTVVHDGLPDPELETMDDGWEHYLERLRVVAGGGDPGPDPWLRESAKQ